MDGWMDDGWMDDGWRMDGWMILRDSFECAEKVCGEVINQIYI